MICILFVVTAAAIRRIFPVEGHNNQVQSFDKKANNIKVQTQKRRLVKNGKNISCQDFDLFKIDFVCYKNTRGSKLIVHKRPGAILAPESPSVIIKYENN